MKIHGATIAKDSTKPETGGAVSLSHKKKNIALHAGKRKKKRNIIIAKWLTEVWGGIGEQKQSGNESQWRRIHFLVPASVGPSPLLSRLSLTRMMAHVYTHEPHARTYFWSGIRKEHSVKPRRSPRQFPRRGRGFFLLFFSLPPSLSFPLSPAHACLELSRPGNLCFSFFLRTRILENPFAEGTVISNKGFNLYLIYPSKLPRELFSLNCN